MKNNIELFINKQLVDLSDSCRLLFTYRIKDVYNPLIVKNSFTKTVTLEGTKNNNQIFNSLYNLDVVYSMDNYKAFNSSKRNSFELYNNGELVESGYMKLDSIKKTGNLVNYNCTLYGGLGDFFYNLMYDSDGNKRTLADLNYLEGGEDEFNFQINADTVSEAWEKLNPSRNRRGEIDNTINIWNYINFMPAYNGIGDTIDTEHILVNTNGYNGTVRVFGSNGWVDSNGFPNVMDDQYRLVNGYALVELPKPMSEWQVRDLRSYMQRPVVSMKGILDAIAKPENNGGYEVIYDDDFFNSSNPYYSMSWVTLPLLNELENKDNEIIETPTITIQQNPVLNVNNIYWEHRIEIPTIINANVNTVTFECDLQEKQSGSTMGASTAYFCSDITNNTRPGRSDDRYRGKQYEGMALQLVGYDATGNKIAGSNLMWLTSELTPGDYWSASEAVNNEYGGIDTQIGVWNRVGSSDFWKWSGRLKFTMDLTNVIVSEFRLRYYYRYKGNDVRLSQTCMNLFASKSFTYDESTYWSNVGKFWVREDSIDTNFGNKVFTIVSGGEDMGIYSNSRINKRMLLTTDNTPADYLLSFGKLFNLYYEKDLSEKKIYVKVMKNYYDGERVDLDNMVDRSREINITPLAFDTNTYSMSYKSEETSELEDKYSSLFGADFGSQRINTGYDFDSQKKELYDGVFTNGVQTLESGRFYTLAFSNDYEVPPFLYANVTYKLFNSSGESSDYTITRPKNLYERGINALSYGSSSTPLVAPYYDGVNKVQFHNEGEPISGKDCLVFFNGFVNSFKPDSSARSASGCVYTLSDDVQEMIGLNEKPCYLYSYGTKNAKSQDICKKITSIPQFSRYTTTKSSRSGSANDINYTMDFGRTKALYVPELRYIDGKTSIYERYWKDYIEDLYDIDTRVVECYVRFDKKVMQDYLKHYYYFDGCYWVLSEIIDYEPNSNNTFKCKFVKVNEFGVYTDYDPAELPSGIILLTINPTTVNSGATSADCYVWIDDGGSWTITDYSSEITPSTLSGSGSTHFTINIQENTGVSEKELYVIVKSHTNYSSEAYITQLSKASDITFTVTEFADYSHSNVPRSGGTCYYTVRSTLPWTVSSDRTYAVPQSSGGTGNTEYGETLRVVWSESDTYGSRQALFSFVNSVGQIITVIKGQDGITGDEYLSYVYGVDGGYYTVNIGESASTVEIQPEWITVINNGDGTFTMEAGENTGTERSGLVVIKPSPTASVIIQLEQESGGSVITGFTISPTTIYFHYTGGYEYLTITNPDSHNWRITDSDDWYGFNQTQGSGISQTISCYAEENTGDTRTSTIEFTDANTGLKYYVYAIQHSSADTPSLSITPNPLSVSEASSTTTVAITYENRDGDFLTATPSSSLVSVGGIVFTGETALVEITVEANPYVSGRTFTVDFIGSYVSETLTINQNGVDVNLTVIPQSLTFDNTGGTATITITSNDRWTIE